MDPQPSSQIHRSASLDSVGSNRSQSLTDNDTESDGPCFSTPKKVAAGGAQRPSAFHQTFPSYSNFQMDQTQGSSEKLYSKSSDLTDSQMQTPNDARDKVFNPPAYELQKLEEYLRHCNLISPEDKVIYNTHVLKPVNVKAALNWQLQSPDKPSLYKMDSYPRGWALIINNKSYNDPDEFPERYGSDNDVIRLYWLLKQFHFEVEYHTNKTKMEMEQIVKDFSEKPELYTVDCVWIIIMSHGQEGESEENHEVVGVDGIGYKTGDIIMRFHNDSCRACINKPKLFFFSSCRGNCYDPGVSIEEMDWKRRIATDGRRIKEEPRVIKIRTQSDIFVAYPTAPGLQANRDTLTGSWFIQTIVDVFSEHAWNNHLEDLIKMVDSNIKKVNNIYLQNFQVISTKTIGWHKNLFFNPGLGRNHQGETFKIENNQVTNQSDDGMDVVDTKTASPGNNTDATIYSRLKNDKDDDSDDEGTKCGSWFNISGCRTS